MIRQQSFTNSSATLYLVATPIGNIEDITFRAINILKSVDIIYAEDTRVSSNLLKHYEINTKLGTYHEFNKDAQAPVIVKALAEGKNIALISDAGMPIISDPGFTVVKLAIAAGYNVVPVPGANAALSALIVSGISPMPFTFCGFLDSKPTKRQMQLRRWCDVKETLIFYEAPHRITEMLSDVLLILGDRTIALVREITKKFEEVIRGTVSEVLSITDTLKGEMVVVIEGSKKEKSYDNISVIEHVNMYVKEGLLVNDAIKRVARDRNLVKQDVYKKYHEI